MALTLEDIKKLTPKQKALFLCLIYVVLGYFYYFYFLQANMEKRSELKVKLQELDQQIAKKERLAAEMEKYAKEVDVLRKAFKMALTKLPIRKEMPELLRSVAQSGKNTGLSFLLFEPQPAIKKPIGAKKEKEEQKSSEQNTAGAKERAAKLEEEDYYEEIPVRVNVHGNYQNTVAFFEKLAKLPRIVNVENINIGDAKQTPGKELLLNINCIVKTYMFVQKTDEKGKKTDEKKP
jgi:type IV pilus assembly protein PilO